MLAITVKQWELQFCVYLLEAYSPGNQFSVGYVLYIGIRMIILLPMIVITITVSVSFQPNANIIRTFDCELNGRRVLLTQVSTVHAALLLSFCDVWIEGAVIDVSLPRAGIIYGQFLMQRLTLSEIFRIMFDDQLFSCLLVCSATTSSFIYFELVFFY